MRQTIPILTLLVAAWLITGCAARDKAEFSETVWAQRVAQTNIADLYAPHFKDGRYFSPWMEMKDTNFWAVLQWKLFHRADYTPEETSFLPRVIPDTAERIRQTRGDFILWIGHNTFLIRIGQAYWIIDPIFSKRALLPARVTPPALTIKELNTIVGGNLHILISHNHYDHLDRASMKKLPSSARVYVPMGLKKKVSGMKKRIVQEMDWWQETNPAEGVRLVCLPAQHWSMRISQGRNKSLWASWLLITPDTTFYFGGDTGYFKGFREIGRKFPGIDYAFLATTAYHPRWFMHYQHMNISEAVKGFEELSAGIFIPTQWGTFPLGSEPVGYPGLDLKRYIQEKDLNVHRYKIMDIGQILPLQAVH